MTDQKAQDWRPKEEPEKGPVPREEMERVWAARARQRAEMARKHPRDTPPPLG